MAGLTVIDGATPGWVIAQFDVALLATPEGAPLAVTETQLLGEIVAEEHAEDHGEGTFPPFDSTYFISQLLWLAISFTVLYMLMARVIIPRIGGILEDRRDRIARDLDQAGRLKQQSDEANAAYAKALADARANAFKIAAEARDKAKGEAGVRQAEIEKVLDQKLVVAEARIGEIKTKALADVGEIAASAAEAVVDRLLGVKPSAGELSSAVDAVRAAGVANA